MTDEANGSNNAWRAKLAAWTHDPAEKALVLLRDPSGHEGGTVAELRRKIFGGSELPGELRAMVGEADHWASAADRPQFPRRIRVQFDTNPTLVHPLDGEEYDLRKLDIDVAPIRAVSLDHFESLIVRGDDGAVDFKRTFLRFWRLGAESPAPQIGKLWQVLPADTRVPTHSIWEHLNLTSALAGAMATDPKRKVALLKLSIGPVQPFIEQSRTTSDLWAGSHLLSRIMWEGLKVLCEEVGPDSVLFPNLRGLPLADAWLKQEHGIEVEGLERRTDENPLFAAAVVNLAVAIAPESCAAQLAERMTGRMREWVQQRAKEAALKIHEEAGIAMAEPVSEQLENQLRGFPEVFWAVCPWPAKLGGEELETLERALARFYPERGGRPGFFGSAAWTVFSQPFLVEEAEFYRPNPGVVYPAVYDLLDRGLGAAKSARVFASIEQSGYRCTLCGEREWLTARREQLREPRGNRENTVWQALAKKRPAWAREGEYLCGLCTLKRLWPTLFVEEVGGCLGQDKPSRFVISTHTMALAPTLEKIVDAAGKGLTQEQEQAVNALVEKIEGLSEQRVALPARLHLRAIQLGNSQVVKLVRGLPALLDHVAEQEEGAGASTQTGERGRIEGRIKELAGFKPEHYYALILMDGDDMGAWVSGSRECLLLRFEQTWHPAVRNDDSLRGGPEFENYRKNQLQASPARHAAVSGALNGFSIHLARVVVEEMHMGKLLYAGGDDVLAMAGIDDLLDMLGWLRRAHSGIAAQGGNGRLQLQTGGGHALLSAGNEGRLFRVMGLRATASAGAVIAHYSAPLQAVLRELRRAEKRAKDVDGKDAFSITLMKRAGGLSHFTAKWALDAGSAEDSRSDTIATLKALRCAFANPLSRQAAYQTLEWLSPLGEDADLGMVESLVVREFRRHLKKGSAGALPEVERTARALVTLAGAVAGRNHLEFIRNAIELAEFLAREGRGQ